MKTNKLLAISIGLNVVIIILVCVFYGFGLRHHKKTGYTHQVSSMDTPHTKEPVTDTNTMDHTMHAMTQRMSGKTGSLLEQTFLEDMIVHHQGAVDMALELQKGGTERPELQQMAKDIIDVQTKEIDMMQEWRDTWF